MRKYILKYFNIFQVSGRCLPFVAAVCGMLSLAGCSSGSDSLSAAVDPCGWRQGEEREFVFRNTDTVSLRELSLFVVSGGRRSGGCDSLALDVTVRTPDSLEYTERVVVPFRPDGDAGVAGCRVFRSHAVLMQEGEYRFVVGHRAQELVRGLRAVGIEITKTENGER